LTAGSSISGSEAERLTHLESGQERVRDLHARPLSVDLRTRVGVIELDAGAAASRLSPVTPATAMALRRTNLTARDALPDHRPNEAGPSSANLTESPYSAPPRVTMRSMLVVFVWSETTRAGR
jgi:hypothetical protein